MGGKGGSPGRCDCGPDRMKSARRHPGSCTPQHMRCRPPRPASVSSAWSRYARGTRWAPGLEGGAAPVQVLSGALCLRLHASPDARSSAPAEPGALVAPPTWGQAQLSPRQGCVANAPPVHGVGQQQRQRPLRTAAMPTPARHPQTGHVHRRCPSSASSASLEEEDRCAGDPEEPTARVRRHLVHCPPPLRQGHVVQISPTWLQSHAESRRT